MKQLCKRVANKLNALTRIAPNLSYNQRRLINKLQERALTATYNDYDSSFSELLEMSNESTIHIKNIKVLITEIYKFLDDLSPPSFFQKQENYYSLRNPRSLVSKRKLTTTYGIDTISFRGPQIWQDLPPKIRNPDSINLFKSNIKRYGTLTCQCKLSKSFIPCVGYID